MVGLGGHCISLPDTCSWVPVVPFQKQKDRKKREKLGQELKNKDNTDPVSDQFGRLVLFWGSPEMGARQYPLPQAPYPLPLLAEPPEWLCRHWAPPERC